MSNKFLSGVFGVAAILALSGPASWANAAPGAGDPPVKGCFFVGGSAVEVAVFDADSNGDEGDYINGFRLTRLQKSDLITPIRKDGAIKYQYRFSGSQRWFSDLRVTCKNGAEIKVP